jgi:hypothetical protein
MTQHVGETIEGLLRYLESRALPDDHPSFRSSTAVDAPGRGRTPKNPLLESGFTAVPRKLDNLAIRLAEYPGTRSMAQVFSLVVLDLAKHTDSQRLDVLVSNGGVSRRRAVGGPGVKAVIRLLIDWGVLGKRRASTSRLAEINERIPGFGKHRRYLVWNEQEKWRLPETDDDLAAVAEFWKRYTGKGGTKTEEVRASTKGTPEYVRPSTTIYTPVLQDY